MKYTLFQESRIGKRPYQQDRLAHWHTKEALFMVVADGMGGHAHGDVAAQITVDCLGSAFRSEANPRVADPDKFLYNIIGRAHAMILHETQRQGLKFDATNSPRTTVVACLVQGGYAYWSFVGDSRLYVIRDGRILTRTRDHTPVQMLVDAGRIREEAAATHPDRNKLLQCLGGPRPPRVEPTAQARLLEDDLVVLCSDGFWGPLTQRQLLMGLIGKDLKKALPELLDLSESRAGPRCDNLTVLAIRWQDRAVPAPVEPVTVPMEELPTDVRDFTATEPDFMHMSDADIERQIAEIKKALAKHDPAKK
ncbi:MAG TPA: PP2C family serine/threonine-protein phosphatase [Burkholderiales bacterium]|jgi:serine/threonine protein phosphatase PrpC|nr:PP2C family serine/threonine-protein phosphatase [Burkholderiales bacterium]